MGFKFLGVGFVIVVLEVVCLIVYFIGCRILIVKCVFFCRDFELMFGIVYVVLVMVVMVSGYVVELVLFLIVYLVGFLYIF